MKNIILTISMVALVTMASAQSPGQGGQRPSPPSSKEMIKEATKKLSLTDEQVVEWEEIHNKYESSMKDRSKAESTRKKMSEELEATLTEDQQNKFKKMRKSQGPPPRRNR